MFLLTYHPPLDPKTHRKMKGFTPPKIWVYTGYKTPKTGWFYVASHWQRLHFLAVANPTPNGKTLFLTIVAGGIGTGTLITWAGSTLIAGYFPGVSYFTPRNLTVRPLKK